MGGFTFCRVLPGGQEDGGPGPVAPAGDQCGGGSAGCGAEDSGPAGPRWPGSRAPSPRGGGAPADPADGDGRAAAAEEAAAHRRHGGGLRYMSPELARAVGVLRGPPADVASRRDSDGGDGGCCPADPEAGRDGGAWDVPADVYSLALVAWELLAGEPPLAHLPDAAAAAAAAAAGSRPPLGGRGVRRAGPGMVALLRRAWAADAAARGSAESALSALQGLAEARAGGACAGRCAVA